jgi:steroid delta-isomerase-like uncharacterized protein
MQHPKKEETEIQSLEEIASRLLDAFNRHDSRALAALYAPDQITTSTGEPEPVRGREAKEEFVAGFFRAFPDMRLEPFSILYTDDHIVFEVDARGTNTGPLETPEGEAPPTGRGIDVKMNFIVRVDENGLIAEDRTCYDTGLFMQQLGFLD